MLIQFIVENFRSFKDEIQFNLIATGDEAHSNHVFHLENHPKSPLLRVASLYGANAAGKSNLIRAAAFAQQLIVHGTKSGQAIAVSPFKLSQSTLQAPGRFEFLFEYRNIVYHYGFLLNAQQICEEWLFVTPDKREVLGFERVTNSQMETQMKFGAARFWKQSKKPFLSFVAQGTRPNQLFLTEAIDRNVPELQPVMDWFNKVLTIIPAESRLLTLSSFAREEKTTSQFMGEFLRSVDTGIHGIAVEEHTLKTDEPNSFLPAEVQQEILSDLEDESVAVVTPEGNQFEIIHRSNSLPVLLVLKTQHKMEDGTLLNFDLSEESEGTQRLMHLLPVLASAQSNEKVFLLDELDRRLHPLLARKFVEAYLSASGNPKRQLIFTTHDTNLLDLNLLRRDEIWFVEKNEQGQSSLFSLAEFKPRPDLKISTSYLNGRFGAIPIIRDLVESHPAF